MVLGLSGAALSGKDTVYGMLRTLSFEGSLKPYLVRREGFADRLKISAARALGFTVSDDKCIAAMNGLKAGGEIQVRIPRINDVLNNEFELSGREYLQFFGTEAHRDVFGQDFWIKAVLPDGYPSKDEQDKTLLVITDVRFPNEAERVRECGGQVWSINRPTSIAESSHVSEQPLPEHLIDRVISNNSSLEGLQKKVEIAAGKLVECFSSP